MNWDQIQTKWTEMTRRLQADVPKAKIAGSVAPIPQMSVLPVRARNSESRRAARPEKAE